MQFPRDLPLPCLPSVPKSGVTLIIAMPCHYWRCSFEKCIILSYPSILKDRLYLTCTVVDLFWGALFVFLFMFSYAVEYADMYQAFVIGWLVPASDEMMMLKWLKCAKPFLKLDQWKFFMKPTLFWLSGTFVFFFHPVGNFISSQLTNSGFSEG